MSVILAEKRRIGNPLMQTSCVTDHEQYRMYDKISLQEVYVQKKLALPILEFYISEQTS